MLTDGLDLGVQRIETTVPRPSLDRRSCHTAGVSSANATTGVRSRGRNHDGEPGQASRRYELAGVGDVVTHGQTGAIRDSGTIAPDRDPNPLHPTKQAPHVIPTSLIALSIITVAVLPGSMYTWAFERQVAAYGANLADRVLRFVALSVLFHLALGWVEYWLFRIAFSGHRFGGGQFAIAWATVAILVVVPAAFGTVIGGLYASRSDRDGWAWIRRRLSAQTEPHILQFILGRTPAPRAWDNMFSERQNLYLRVETTDGTAVAGLFADKSYAGGFPHDADLFLEESWSMRDDGSLDQPLGYPVYLPAGQIARIETLNPWNQEQP